MNALTHDAQGILGDARTIFDYYLAATQYPSFIRIGGKVANGIFWYPENTVQVDVGAFAGVFICLWRAIAIGKNFRYYYMTKPEAFAELARIVTPNDPDTREFTSHARFWKFNVRTPVIGVDGMKELCRTLRNGFAHFNFRYIDVAPSDYFRQMNLLLPNFIPQPDVANNYRIFICDWNKSGTKKFMEPDSETRIIETHFAHLRYHLFMFLARLFSEPDHQYKDILTLQTIS